MDKFDYRRITDSLDFREYKFKTINAVLINVTLLAVVMTPWLLESHSVLKVLVAPILTLLMYRSFALFHEGCHGLLSQNKAVNYLLSVLISPFCILSFEAWKKSHLQHHYWTGNIDKDPVMAFVKIYPKLNPLFKKFLNSGWALWLPVLGLIQHIVFWSITLAHLKNDTKTKNLFSVIYPITFLVTILALSPSGLLVYTLLPSLYLYLVGTEAINLPHHLQLPFIGGEDKLFTREQHKVSRSCIYPEFITDHFVMGFNYHTEHHMFPQAHWYHLKKIHGMLKAELGSSYNSEGSFEWIRLAHQLDLANLLQGKDKEQIQTQEQAS